MLRTYIGIQQEKYTKKWKDFIHRYAFGIQLVKFVQFWTENTSNKDGQTKMTWTDILVDLFLWICFCDIINLHISKIFRTEIVELIGQFNYFYFADMFYTNY